MKKLVNLVLSIASTCLIFLLCSATALADGDVPQTVLDLRKSVVRVVCQSSDGTFHGSGFAIGKGQPVKYVVTNLHVVEPDMNNVSILRLKNQYVPAKVHVQIPNSDLCVLLLDDPLYGVPPVTLSDEKIADVGQAVFTLGFPGAADILSDALSGDPEDVTITDGIISSHKSLTLVEPGTPVQLLQINAAINPGNSGGPLVNRDGQVVGINTYAVIDSQNTNGAISVLELTGSLRSRGIEYLSVQEPAGESTLMMTIALAGGGALLLIIIVLVVVVVSKRKKKRDRRGTPLAAYLSQWGGRLPYEAAVRVLTPVLKELVSLHSSGACHGDIHPENIVVHGTNQAMLLPPDQHANKVILRPHFSSPEHYRADGRIGPWSDVYSICAVLYYMITGSKPAGVLERSTDQDGGVSLTNANINQAQGDILLSGLSIDAARRPQNAIELANALGIVIDSQSMTAEVDWSKETKVRRKKGRGRGLLLAAGIVVLVLCAGAGFYFYQEYRYNLAVECINRQDYKGGIENLTSVIRGYKDSADLMIYTCSGDALLQGQYDQARNGFAQLGAYSNSSEMMKEVDYQQALELLNNKSFEQARKLFSSLGAYKNSEQMLTEVDYQEGLSCLDSGNYSSAINIFLKLDKKKFRDAETLLAESRYQSAQQLYKQGKYVGALQEFEKLGLYQDSAKLIENAAYEIYDDAVAFYRQRKYDNARGYFTYIEKYIDCSRYLTLINGHSKHDYDSNRYTDMKALYNRIKALGNFEDAETLRESNAFIYYRLEGSWKDNRGYSISMIFNRNEKSWYLWTNLPKPDGKYYKISSQVVSYGDDKPGWKKAYELSFISENKIEVYCHQNKRIYTLVR